MDMVSGVGVLDKAVHVLRSVAAEPRSLAELQQAHAKSRKSGTEKQAPSRAPRAAIRRQFAGRSSGARANGAKTSRSKSVALAARPIRYLARKSPKVSKKSAKGGT